MPSSIASSSAASVFAIVVLYGFFGFTTCYRSPINCYHCASSEYRPLFQRIHHLSVAYRSQMSFGNFCDHHYTVHQTAAVVSCEFSCVTIFESQYIGGLINQAKPYVFIRGCATDIFALTGQRPAEIDFLHRGEICLSVPQSQIWPDALSNEPVQVCSCTRSGCNLHDAVSLGSASRRPRVDLLLLSGFSGFLLRLLTFLSGLR